MHQVDEEDQHGDGWLGCACPACHQVFRVPETSAGKQAQCPNCDDLVDIPLTARRVENDFRHMEEFKQTPEAGADGTGRRRIRHHGPAKAPEPVEDLTWDQNPAPVRKRVRRKQGFRILILVGAVIIIGVGVFVWSRTVLKGVEEPDVSEVDPLFPPESPSVGVAAQDGPKESVGELDPTVVLEPVRLAVARFLQAESVDEMLKFVRGGEREREKIRRYYASKVYVAQSPLHIAPNGGVRTTGTVMALVVILRDQSSRSIAVEKLGDRYLIDWESWVGYSDLSWEELQKTRPIGPKTFRVLCSNVEYYNFEFSDDRKWRSYRLQSPDQLHTLYGYVRRNSPQEQRLSSVDKNRPGKYSAFVVKLRYPKREGRKDQVLIDEVRTEGWVLDLRTPETAER